MEPEQKEPELKKDEKPQITTYELQDLVRRCLDELEQAQAIKKLDEQETRVATFEVESLKDMESVLVITDREQIIQHISNTIIGELYELEIIRKMAPIFREVRRLTDDFNMLDDREQKRINLAGLRIAPDSQQ